jgi:hypothetical protein
MDKDLNKQLLSRQEAVEFLGIKDNFYLYGLVQKGMHYLM